MEESLSPFAIRAADTLAAEVTTLVKAGKVDARSRAGDAVLEYAITRFGSDDPIGDLLKCVEKIPPSRKVIVAAFSFIKIPIT